MPLLLRAIEYSQNPDSFVDENTTDIEHPLYKESINTFTGTYSSMGFNNTKTIVEEIASFQLRARGAIAIAYAVSGIPANFLIANDGTIVASENETRGDDLAKLLEELIQ